MFNYLEIELGSTVRDRPGNEERDFELPCRGLQESGYLYVRGVTAGVDETIKEEKKVEKRETSGNITRLENTGNATGATRGKGGGRGGGGGE